MGLCIPERLKDLSVKHGLTPERQRTGGHHCGRIETGFRKGCQVQGQLFGTMVAYLLQTKPSARWPADGRRKTMVDPDSL